MGRKFVVLVLILGVSMCAVSAYAGERYGEHNAATKLGRGMANLVGCYMEIPKQIFLTVKEKGTLTGIVFGGAKGLGYTLMRLAEGLYEIAFFLFPPYDEELMETDFVFEGWEDDPCKDY